VSFVIIKLQLNGVNCPYQFVAYCHHLTQGYRSKYSLVLYEVIFLIPFVEIHQFFGVGCKCIGVGVVVVFGTSFRYWFRSTSIYRSKASHWMSSVRWV